MPRKGARQLGFRPVRAIVRVVTLAPPFTEDEVVALWRIESILARHPYMRADLRGLGPIAKDLEGVLSMRLALQHTEGSAGAGRGASALLGKLRVWEAQLADAMIDEEY